MSPPVENNSTPFVAARWNFEGVLDGITPDSSENENHLTVAGGVSQEFGWVDMGVLAFNGVDGHASTDSVPIDTTVGFTLAGWFRSHEMPGEFVTAFGVTGERESAVTLRFLPCPGQYGWGEWEVSLTDSDGEDAVVTRLSASEFPSEVGYWVHVAVVYDRSARALRLYVNGERTAELDFASTPFPPTFRANGSFQVGRSLNNGERGECWPGTRWGRPKIFRDEVSRQGLVR
ncbi:LamG domain-containing protein [Streptomyces sp. ST2-7A]|uniref:LamG domain-containing protein n=1 Tax=Streptomyces sp. ST2-7A TaxID=2907214 RepID=UPI001F3B42D2|nr:LamG domain-containing protein [Streptomyces sp. ST2-7A]MCE7079205.1 LamG domain-containing protein [Streptomyces sp. ST2-7A]